MKAENPHDHWMRYAIACAEQAGAENEVPVGAVLVKNNTLIASGYNRPISEHDPTAHAEIQALRASAKTLGNYRIPNTILYVTLEPCLMCVGAIIHARVSQVVFGAYDPKKSVSGGAVNLFEANFANHQTKIIGGILANECGQLLTAFFKKRR